MEVAAAKQLLPMARAPNSPSSSTSSSSPSSAASPSPRQQQHHPVPPSPKPVPRIIDTTPFPTTFVQADTANFKQVVQRLTGSDTPSSAQNKPAKGHHHHHHHHHNHGGASGLAGGPKKPAFKLYERRIGKNNLKMIAPLAMAAAAAAGASPRKVGPEVLSPSVLDFPSLALGSPVTPLVADPFNRSPASASPGEEEEAAERAAIARKGFFLHPSPRGAEPPRLLPLFPVTSPRMAPSPAAAAAAPSSQ
ncbi:hypothetical protein SETIT_3G176500v2 [Setaria italica]|uniref:VQ domain-containing protein n=1 Tax=Setaria italica TaxID=4555 RepID=K3Z945_SETIT|nr:VQ motif-containing protein 4 [Setaria italica]RCV16914.1 hypothetical protein SETIT_3G176500v2 [Setaria italica]